MNLQSHGDYQLRKVEIQKEWNLCPLHNSDTQFCPSEVCWQQGYSKGPREATKTMINGNKAEREHSER